MLILDLLGDVDADALALLRRGSDLSIVAAWQIGGGSAMSALGQQPSFVSLTPGRRLPAKSRRSVRAKSAAIRYVWPYYAW